MVKKLVCILPAVCLLVLLRGCTHYPAQAADGTVWNENWATLGSVLGVEEPGNGFSLLENNAILIADELNREYSWKSKEQKNLSMNLSISRSTAG